MSAQEPEDEVQVPSRGQITAPNPLELFWETHKKKILFGVVMLGIVLAGNAYRKYQQNKNRNYRWNLFAKGLNLEKGYAPLDLDVPDFSSIFQRGANATKGPQSNAYGVDIAVGGYWTKLKEKRLHDLAARSKEELEQTISDLEGESGARWALWALACKYRAEGKETDVKQVLDRIAKIDADFPTSKESKFPPIYVPLPDLPEDQEEDDDDARVPEAFRKTSIDKFMLTSVKKDQEYKLKRPDLFAAPEPDAKPVITFETSIGTILVRLYGKKAPKHCANFIEKCESGFYNGLYFHQIQKQKKATSGFNVSSGFTAELCFLGNPKAKDEDRSTWGDDYHSEKQIDFEDNGISHFPFMLAADRQMGKLNSDSEIVYFTGNDCARERDQAYVVFGRVMEGHEIIRKLVTAKLMTTPQEEAGLGKPKEDIKVIKVTVQK